MGKLITLFVLATLAAACTGYSGADDQRTFSTSYQGCPDAMSSFLTEYAGSYSDKVNNLTAITLGTAGAFSLQAMRQVATTANNLPNPTNCSYLLTGQIYSIYSLTSQKCMMRSSTYPTANTIIDYDVHSVTLNDTYLSGTIANPNCRAWASQINALAGQNQMVMHDYIETIDANSFQFLDLGSGPAAGELMTR